MRKARFTEHQIIAVRKSLEAGRTVKGVCRETGISEASYYKWKAKNGGATIRGASDVTDREGSIELRGLHHSITIPTDPMTGKVTGTRQHAPFQFTKELDSASPYLFKAAATGQTLKSAEFRFYHINDAQQCYYLCSPTSLRITSPCSLA